MTRPGAVSTAHGVSSHGTFADACHAPSHDGSHRDHGPDARRILRAGIRGGRDPRPGLRRLSRKQAISRDIGRPVGPRIDNELEGEDPHPAGLPGRGDFPRRSLRHRFRVRLGRGRRLGFSRPLETVRCTSSHGRGSPDQISARAAVRTRSHVNPEESAEVDRGVSDFVPTAAIPNPRAIAEWDAAIRGRTSRGTGHRGRATPPGQSTRTRIPGSRNLFAG